MSVDPIGGVEKTSAGFDAARQAYRNPESEQRIVQPPAQTPASTEQDPVSISLQRMSSTMGKLETVNEERNRFATKIRDTNTALQKMSPLVNGMKETLTAIVKNYPPFPVDSQERKDLLMSYAALRKEILSMTIPAPPQPVYEKNAGLWDRFGLSEESSLSEAVPELSVSETDTDVGTALAGVSVLSDAVASGRSELVKAVSE